VSFIKHRPAVKSIADQGVALGIAASYFLRTSSQEVYGKPYVNAIQYLERLREASPPEGQDDEQIDVRVFGGAAMGIGPKENYAVGMEFPGDLAADIADFPNAYHASEPTLPDAFLQVKRPVLAVRGRESRSSRLWSIWNLVQ
jgi:hypothetical protein